MTLKYTTNSAFTGLSNLDSALLDAGVSYYIVLDGVSNATSTTFYIQEPGSPIVKIRQRVGETLTANRGAVGAPVPLIFTAGKIKLIAMYGTTRYEAIFNVVNVDLNFTPAEPPDPEPEPATRVLMYSASQTHSSPAELDGASLDEDTPYWIWLEVDNDATVDQVEFILDDVSLEVVSSANAPGEWWLGGSAAGGGTAPVRAGAVTSIDADAVNHNIALPGSLSVGDLMVVVFGCEADPGTVTWPAGWLPIATVLASDSSMYLDVRCKVRVAEATEIVVTTTNVRNSAHNAFRITGALNPATAIPEVDTRSAASATIDPDALVTAAGTRNYLWLVCGTRHRYSATAAPTNYGNFLNVHTGVEGVIGEVATFSADRTLEAASEDPGIFAKADTQSFRYITATIAISPSDTSASGHDSTVFADPSQRTLEANVTEV